MSQGVYFYLYSAIKTVALRLSPDLTVAKSLLVAALAGCGNVLLTNPIWVVVTRMQVRGNASPGHSLTPRRAAEPDLESGAASGPGQERQESAQAAAPAPAPPGVWEVVRDLYRESGVRGFWKGLAPSLVMVSNPTIQYVLYEALAKRCGGGDGALACGLFVSRALLVVRSFFRSAS